MALASTAPLITIQDGSGQSQAAANGSTVWVQPGMNLSITLTNGTSGIGRWDLQFICPAYPSLHQRIFTWLPGQSATQVVPMPSLPVGGTTALNGIEIVSTTSDSSGGSVPSATVQLQTRGATPNALDMQLAADYVIVASLPAYTNTNGVLNGNSNGAITSTMADGATPAVGDVFLLEQGLAASAADAGLYQIAAVGASGAKFQAVQIGYGTQMMPGTEIIVSQRGTVFKGTTWVNTLAGTHPGGAGLVGTDSFTFYPRQVIYTAALVAGIQTSGASGTSGAPAVMSVMSTSLTYVGTTRRTPNTSSSTISYQKNTAGMAAGGLGTGAASVFATVAAGTVNASDVSTMDTIVINPC